MSSPRVSIGWIATYALLLFSSAEVVGQGETGSVAGVVRDETGLALPGVTVQISGTALIGGARSTATDGDGRYQIISLRPGTYSVTFELPGFGTVQRAGVELSAAFVATVNAEMKVGGLQEAITVSGRAPTVDVKSVTQQRSVSREVIDALPTAKTFGALGALIPGVVVNRPDVGGSAGDLSASLTIHGSRSADSQIMMDGMSTANGQGSGSYGHFFANTIFQEVTIETGGMSAEYDGGGVRSNLIPREGGNTFKGLYFGSYTDHRFNSKGGSSDLPAGTQTNAVNRIWDANPAGGGYLVKDKVWFFLSFRQWGTTTTRAGTSAAFPNADPAARIYVPDTSRLAFDHTWHRDASNRMTWQATPRNKISALYDIQDHEYEFNTDSVGNAPETRSFYRETPQYLVQASWSSPLSNRVLLEAGGTLAANDWVRLPQPEVVPGVSPITELATNFSYRASPTASYGRNRSNNYNYRASAAYVTGSHSFKSGLFFQNTWSYTTTEPNNPVGYSVRNGVPVSLLQWGTPISYREKLKYNAGLYAQDRWTLSRATINLGVRADFLNAYVVPQSLPAGPFIGAREFDGVENVPNWKDVSPRLGVAYDLFGDGRTAIKANLGGFPLVTGLTNFTRLANPMATTVNSVSRTWTDTNGNFAPDCDLTNQLANAECGQMQNLNFGKSVPVTRYADDVSEGFGVRAYNWESAVSFQHELVQGLSVNASYHRRWYRNFQVTQNLAVTNADFSPFCLTVPVDSRLPGGGGNQLCGFYDVSAAKLGRNDNVIGQAAQFGTQTEVYDGFDFTGNARLSHGILMSGGVTMGRASTNNCELTGDLSLAYAGSATGVTAPRETPFCDVRPPMLPNIKFLTVYPIPFGGLQFSGTWQSTPGPEITASYAATNAEIAPSLGRDLSAGRNGTVLVDLMPKGALYGERINQVDLRLSKTLRFGARRVQAMFDLYNAFNARPFLSMQNRFGPAWQTPTSVLIGRLAKFGMQVDF